MDGREYRFEIGEDSFSAFVDGAGGLQVVRWVPLPMSQERDALRVPVATGRWDEDAGTVRDPRALPGYEADLPVLVGHATRAIRGG